MPSFRLETPDANEVPVIVTSQAAADCRVTFTTASGTKEWVIAADPNGAVRFGGVILKEIVPPAKGHYKDQTVWNETTIRVENGSVLTPSGWITSAKSSQSSKRSYSWKPGANDSLFLVRETVGGPAITATMPNKLGGRLRTETDLEDYRELLRGILKSEVADVQSDLTEDWEVLNLMNAMQRDMLA